MPKKSVKNTRPSEKKLSFYTKEGSSSNASYNALQNFPMEIKEDAVYQLKKIQKGNDPTDAKPMKTIGVGVFELRLSDEKNEYRIIYIAKLKDFIWVLHAFNKKTQSTRQSDIDIAKRAYKDILQRDLKEKSKRKKLAPTSK